MISKIKNKLRQILLGNEVENFTIAGVDLKGLKGTYRPKTDQDDAWFFELAKNHKIVMDVGSNIGYMSLIAAIQNKNEGVILVDPNPAALSKASQNLILNGFGIKSKFISAFVGEKDGEKVKFYTVGAGAAGSMFAGHAETASRTNSFFHVDKLTIDTIVNQLDTVPDLVKVDVEGAEGLALQGAKGLASKKQSKFIVEMHAPPELPMKENATNILNWCKANGYKAYYMKEAAELKGAETIAHRGKCHLLLIPEQDNYPEYLKLIKQGDSLPNSID